MPKVSEEHLEARRNQILDAATVCFATHGVGETTIAKICEQASLSPGAVYRYFDSKRAILDAVYGRSIRANQALVGQLTAAPDPLFALRAMVGAMVGFIDDPDLRIQHHLSIQVHAAGLSDPALAKSYTNLHRTIVHELTPLMTQLVEQGRVRSDLDPEYFCWVVVTIYQGLRVQRMLDPDLDMKRFAAAFAQIVDGGLGEK